MALFDVFKKGKKSEFLEKQKRKKEEAEKEKVAEGEPRQGREKKTEALSKASNFVSGIFLKPHIAEKSTTLNERGAYVFEINKNTNKVMVKQAVREKYGVLPRKVNIVNIPSRKISLRGKKGTKKGLKKAVVYLRSGEKIELA